MDFYVYLLMIIFRAGAVPENDCSRFVPYLLQYLTLDEDSSPIIEDHF